MLALKGDGAIGAEMPFRVLGCQAFCLTPATCLSTSKHLFLKSKHLPEEIPLETQHTYSIILLKYVNRSTEKAKYSFRIIN